jgi:CMP-N-acetylneuraminic acid synthetase
MIQNNKVIALVPIKENSERVKGKNFKDFCGKPLFHHILLTLDQVVAIDEIIINTDSPVIKEEAPKISEKIKVRDRNQTIVGDFVSMNRIIEDDIKNTNGDIYLQTHTTNPLLKEENISKAIHDYLQYSETKNYDSLFSVTEHQARFYSKDTQPINHDPNELLRTQDLTPIYEENSCLYIFNKESFSKKQQRIGDAPYMFTLPKIESVDIDDAYTFKLAELLALYASK